MRNIYCICGRSGSGKTTLADGLEAEEFKVIQSYTTRPPRYAGETGHTFVSPDEFKTLGELVAYTKINGCEYGVPQKDVDENDIYVIDVVGIKELKEKYHGKKGICVIGLGLSEEGAASRMRRRGDSEENINKRLEHDKEAFAGVEEISDFFIDTEIMAIPDILNSAIEYIYRVETEGSM